MSDDAKKPGPDPERLVIEDDPGELGKTQARLRPETWADFVPAASYALGVYEAVVATGSSRQPLPYELHHTKMLDWCIRGRAPEPTRNILRVRWLRELPE